MQHITKNNSIAHTLLSDFYQVKRSYLVQSYRHRAVIELYGLI